MNTYTNLTFTIQIFKEGKTFVSHSPELNVSSCGKTLEESRKNLKDAINGFIKSAYKIGTLNRILEEAGYLYKNKKWLEPNLLVLDRLSLAV